MDPVQLSGQTYDLVIAGGRVIDPANGIDGIRDIAVRDGKVAAVAEKLPAHRAKQVLDVTGRLVIPGMIDMHAHVYEWITTFGLPPDDAGIHSGCTTIVDQGGAGAYTFHGFKHYIVDRSRTDVRSFPSINLCGILRGGLAGPLIHTPELVDVGLLVEVAQEYPHLIRGFGEIHAESGAYSRWGTRVIDQAREAAVRTGLPLYVHTGELMEVVEENRPDPEVMIDAVLDFAKPGDMLAHCYSSMPDGVMGDRKTPSAKLRQAVADGLLLDTGTGINFCFDIARRMMDAGLLPYTVSSDVHGQFGVMHDDSLLDYSLVGTVSKLVALGMPLADVIAGVTINPAKVLKADHEIGSLGVGMRADVTILDVIEETHTFWDGRGLPLEAETRHVPAWVVAQGEVIRPNCRLLRDVLPQGLPEAAE